MRGDRSRRRVSPRTVLVLIAIVLPLAAWVVVTSPFFDVRRVEVHGNRRLSDAAVRRLASIGEGTGLLTLSLQRVERLLLTSPWVATADASRALPNALVLDIRERRPVGQVGDPGGVAVLAPDGIVVEHLSAPDPWLPSVGRSRRLLRPGARAAVATPVLRVAASFDRRLRRQVAEVRAVRGEIRLTLIAGVRVRYGTADLLPQKNAAIRGMLRYGRREGVEIALLDVRAPASPVLRQVGPSPIASPTPSPGG